MPTFQATSTFHGLMHGCHHYTCEHAPNLSNRCEDGGSFGDLGRLAVDYLEPHFQGDGLHLTYYHEPNTYIVPLYKLASIKPWKKRTAQSCLYVLHAAEHIVRPDQRRRVRGSQMLGRTFWMISPWGIWPTTMLKSC